MNRANPLLVLAVALLVLNGCATPARVSEMTIPADSEVTYRGETPLENAITMGEVTGGDKTNPLWTSEIGNEEFQLALFNSLEKTKLFSQADAAQYTLDAQILSVKQPIFGLSLEVVTTVAYELVGRKRGYQVWGKTISSPYTAKFSDHFIAMVRLKLANEGSGRENIKQLIDALYALQIDPPGDLSLDAGTAESRLPDRIKELDTLHSQKLISDEEYANLKSLLTDKLEKLQAK
jgi:hypothetical protein